MLQTDLERLVGRVAELEAAADAAAYLIDHLPGLLPPDSAYWRQTVGVAVGLLESVLVLLRQRLDNLGLE